MSKMEKKNEANPFYDIVPSENNDPETSAETVDPAESSAANQTFDELFGDLDTLTTEKDKSSMSLGGYEPDGDSK